MRAGRVGAVVFGVALGTACNGGGGGGTTADGTESSSTATTGGTATEGPTTEGPTTGGTATGEPTTGGVTTEDSTTGGIASGHPRIALVDPATRARLVAAIEGERPAATRFVEVVDSEMAGTEHYAFQPWFAALLGELTGTPDYCGYAIELTDAEVAAEEARIAMGEPAEVAGDSYLYIGEIVGNLALVFDWCYAELDATQRERWLAYANQAVWNVWHHEEATWGGAPFPWSGWSVDNPSNNYYYSFLQATLFLGLAAYEEHPEAPGWVTMFREAKIGDELVPTFTSDLAGGGSREGTGYGTSMARLFRLYEFWATSTGEAIHDLTPHTRASLVHLLHTVVPTLDRIAPVGDHARDSTAALFDYHRDYVQTLAFLYKDDPLAATARWWLQACSVPTMSQHFMAVWDFWYDPGEAPAADGSELHTAYFAPGTGQLYGRSSWETDATWVHLIGGPYTESHAHRDQGSILLYRGEWLAYDQNIESHSGIRQEEEMHNLVRIAVGGETIQQQGYGQPAEMVALADAPEYMYAAVDVTPIYDGEAAVNRVEREVVFIKPDVLVVFDRVDAAPGSERVWQLNAPIQPVINGASATIAGDTATLEVARIHPAGVESSIFDWTQDDDMYGGFRLDTADAEAGGTSRFLHVLSVDGAVVSATASDQGSQLGVAITLMGDATAIVRFEVDTIGGVLELDGATIPLMPGVAALPEMGG